MLDLKIVGGEIIDGTGAPAFPGDVGIRDGRITAIGKIEEPAKETIDATGKVISPGFIDAHTHYDAQVFWDPNLSPSCFHGVTSVIAGLCGFSIAPLNAESAAYLLPMLARVEGMPQKALQKGVPWNWSTFREYLDCLEGKLGINAGFMVGHSAVRRYVMGPRAVGEKATPEDMTRMKREVVAALSAGAIGFSTTVSPSHNDADGNPVPSRHATQDEILELGSLVKDFEGTTLELLPNLALTDDTVELLTKFSLAGQRPVNWNLIVVGGTGEKDRERVDRAIHASKYARERGAIVAGLTLPEGATVRINFVSGFIFDALPGWAPFFRLSLAERKKRLTDPAFCETLKASAESSTGMERKFANWSDYVLAETRSVNLKHFEGQNFGMIAQTLKTTPFQAMIDFAIRDDLTTSFMMPGEESAESYKMRGELMRSDYLLIGGSDSGAHMDMIDTFAFSTKVLEKARTHGLMPIEEVVHRITQRNAKFFGLRDRGEIREGAFADLVVFDPKTVACGPAYMRYDLPGTTTEGRLYADAIGISCVIVNGELFVKDNKIVGKRNGCVLRAGKDTYTPRLPEPTIAAAV